jgi:hypothetical protein
LRRAWCFAAASLPAVSTHLSARPACPCAKLVGVQEVQRRRFRGVRASPSSPALVLVEDADSGAYIGALEHRPRYSVTGFNWGYDGAGPRDLARALLATTLGDEAACARCGGPATERCRECVDGLRPDLPDVELVRDVVARLSATRVLLEDQLRRWWRESSRPVKVI